jgi:hypothetical protein
MTLTDKEAGQVLTAAQLLDNRSWTTETARAWARLIDKEVTLDVAYAAVQAHYARSERYLMPAHINAYALSLREPSGEQRAVERDRLSRAGEVDFPNGLDREQEREYRLSWQAYIKAGASPQQATDAADAELGYSRGPEIPMPREVRQLMAGFVNAHAAR